MKYFLGLFLLFSAVLSAAPVQSYQELVAGMRLGKRFTILVDHNQGLGYFVPTGMILIPASENSLERVAASNLHFSDYPGFPIYEYVKYTFYSDNSAVIQIIGYDAQDFTPIAAPHILNVSIGKGVQVHASEVN